MRLRRLSIVLLLLYGLSACGPPAIDVSLLSGTPSPTPFQPLSATEPPVPTSYYLPTLTPPPAAGEALILPEALPVDVTVPAFSLPGDLNPLTGLPPADPALLARRPLAIKVANYPRYIRPQSGLTLADHVFEYYIEAGLTRFVAIFYGSSSDWVGPVRSGRYFDEHVQRMYQAFLVFKFADPRVLDHFRASDFADYIVVPTIGSCPPFRLMTSRNLEEYNNSYFYSPGWEDCTARVGLDNSRPLIRDGFFSDLAPPSGLPGTRVATYYSFDSYHYWEYDPATRQYLRYQETGDNRSGKPDAYAPLLDQATGETVHASNVIVLLAPHQFANTFDREDEVFRIDLTGSGEAYLFRDGVGMPARWLRTNGNQPLLITGTDGNLAYLRPGITFYEVIGSHSYISQEADGWRFYHDTP